MTAFVNGVISTRTPGRFDWIVIYIWGFVGFAFFHFVFHNGHSLLVAVTWAKLSVT